MIQRRESWLCRCVGERKSQVAWALLRRGKPEVCGDGHARAVCACFLQCSPPGPENAAESRGERVYAEGERACSDEKLGTEIAFGRPFSQKSFVGRFGRPRSAEIAESLLSVTLNVGHSRCIGVPKSTGYRVGHRTGVLTSTGYRDRTGTGGPVQKSGRDPTG
jgi:hypothetical protein